MADRTPKIHRNLSVCASIGLSILLIVASPPQAAIAHIVGNWQQLDQTGFVSPFGRNSDMIYTEVWGQDEIALLGSIANGVAVVDISNPSSLRHIGTYDNGLGEISDVKTFGAVGYFASADGAGIHLTDLSDPTAPVWLSTIAPNSQNGFGTLAETVLQQDVLFSVSPESSWVKAFDVSDPTSPRFVREFNTGDTTGLMDLKTLDDRLFVAGAGGESGEGAVYVYDISNIQNDQPTKLAQFATGPQTASLATNRDASKLFVTHAELGGALEVWDIVDLDFPTKLTSATIADVNDNSFGTSEVMVLDQIAYVAWLQAGVQAVDFDNLDIQNQLQFLGGYDTSPTSSPLDGQVGNRSVYAGLGHDRILLSDSQWGLFLVDASNVVPSIGDLNNNGSIDAGDLDILTLVVREGEVDLRFDLDRNGEVNVDDRSFFISDLAKTIFGDSNFDQRFDSSDLVFVFIGGKYEDGIPLNATWDTGDWNGDGDFDTGDMIVAFQAGGYELGAASMVLVSEPNPDLFFASLLILVLTNVKIRRKLSATRT